MSTRCKNCGRDLVPLEIALTKKLINRGSREFLCLSCLSAYFSVSEGALCEKAREFQKSGCALFSNLPVP